MKPDILERLMMDNALGRLDPDVEVLLADYLTNDPVAAMQARELQETVQLATEVLHRPAPVVEMPTQINQLIWRHRTERLLALAASFIIGVGLTAAVIHGTPHQENVALAHPPTVAKIQRALVKNQIESLPFWSNQRIYLLASAAANSKENIQ
jgi:anti-sigma factor RsiW